MVIDEKMKILIKINYYIYIYIIIIYKCKGYSISELLFKNWKISTWGGMNQFLEEYKKVSWLQNHP